MLHCNRLRISSRFWALNILGARPWPFKVTICHRTRDDSIPHMLFPIGDPLKLNPYLQALSRYSASSISRSRPCPFGQFWGHVTSCSMWPFDTAYGFSYRCSIVTDSLSPAVFEILGPNNTGITTLTFQGHVTSSVTWRFDSAYAVSYWCSIGNEPLSSTVFDIFVSKYI